MGGGAAFFDRPNDQRLPAQQSILTASPYHPCRQSCYTMRVMLSRTLSLLIWIWIAVATLVFTLMVGLSTLLTAPFDRTRRVPQRITAAWAGAILWANPFWRLTVVGQQHLPRRGAYMLVSNHASLADIIVLYQLKSPFKWIAKDSLFRVPLLGWSMRWAGNIRLVRGSQRSIRASFMQALQCLKTGMPVMAFPEGTRSRTGQLGPFKRGPFQLAVKAAVPVIPVVVCGTRDIIAPHSWTFLPAKRMNIRVLPAIHAPPDAANAADWLCDRARTLISETIEADAAGHPTNKS